MPAVELRELQPLMLSGRHIAGTCETAPQRDDLLLLQMKAFWMRRARNHEIHRRADQAEATQRPRSISPRRAEQAAELLDAPTNRR